VVPRALGCMAVDTVCYIQRKLNTNHKPELRQTLKALKVFVRVKPSTRELSALKRFAVWYEYIHTRDNFRIQLHWTLLPPGETELRLERGANWLD
jgi:hypothetical protein